MSEDDVASELQQLAMLVRSRNAIDLQLAQILGRPATAGKLALLVPLAALLVTLAKA